MTSQTENETVQAQKPESPVKDYSKGGRKAKTYVTAGIQQRLDSAAEKATAIIEKHIEVNTDRRSFKHLAPDLQRAIEYTIDHSVGKARQKIEHSGGILTYGILAKEAELLERKPREFIADAEEIGSKQIAAPSPQPPLEAPPQETSTSEAKGDTLPVVEDTGKGEQ